jgi:hypothetical protein
MSIQLVDTGISVTLTNDSYLYDIPKAKYTIMATALGAVKAATAISKAAAAVVTITNHGLLTGNIVEINDALGGDFVNLNSTKHVITVLTVDTFTIPVNTSGYSGTYTASSAQVRDITNVQVGFWGVDNRRIVEVPIRDITAPTYTDLGDLLYQLRLLFQESSAPAVDAVVVTPDTPYLEARAIYVGGDGNLTVTVDGVDVLFSNMIGGTILPVRSTEVIGSGTTATNLVALY